MPRGSIPKCSLSHHLLSLTMDWRNSPYTRQKFSSIRSLKIHYRNTLPSEGKLFKAELAFVGITLLSIVETISSIVIIIFSGPLLLCHIAPPVILHLWYKNSLMSIVWSFKSLYFNLNEPYLKKYPKN